MKKIKRVRNTIIILLSIFTSFVIYTIYENTQRNESFLKEMLLNEAKSNFNNIVDTRKWNAMHGGVYVKKTPKIEPNKYLEENTLLTKENEVLIKINPAWMTRQISEISNKDHNNYFKITSLKPLNPINKPDSFETEALNFFEKNPKEEFYSKISDDFSKFDFMGSLQVTEDCLQCHRKQDYKIGDIRGGIRISIPTTNYYKTFYEIEKKERFLMFLVIFATTVLILLFIFLFKKLIASDLKIKKNLHSINNLKSQKEQLILRYEYAIEGSKDGLWDWNIKDNTIYFSKSWKEMLGFKDDEISNSLNEWEKRVHPDDLEQAYKDIENNQKQITSHYQNIHRMKHKDGSWIWILDRGKTYFNEENKAIRMVGFHSNITELKNLEMDLQRVKKELQEFKFIIESAPISILITDVNANIIYVNPQFTKTTQFTKEEVLGQNPKILRFENDKDSKEKIKNMWKTILNKQTWGGIFKNKKKDGNECWETATILPILDANGEIINYLGILREITKELYMEKELKEKEEMMIAQSRNAAMGEMISMIAHQWRQPITTISMNANNIIADIQLGEFDTKIVEEIAKNIGEQTQFLSKTIDDFRNFFKEDKDIKLFSISELLNELNSIMMASINNNNIKFNINYEENFEINSHKRELLQVLLNVVKNAKEALVENKIKDAYINIDISKIKDEIEFRILDNAGGIKKEYLERIFDAYFTTKNDINGTGLGLYMSKIIIEKHLKGKIEASNEKDGAEFKILIKQDLSI